MNPNVTFVAPADGFRTPQGPLDYRNYKCGDRVFYRDCGAIWEATLNEGYFHGRELGISNPNGTESPCGRYRTKSRVFFASCGSHAFYDEGVRLLCKLPAEHGLLPPQPPAP